MHNKKLEQAVILAGGTGERLKPLTENTPKPLASVNDIPFLEYLLKTVQEAGIVRVVLLLGYKAQMIVDFCEKYSQNSKLVFDYVIGEVEDQTGRRLLNAYSKLDEHFLLMYADNYWPIALKEMWAFYCAKDVEVSTTVFANHQGTGEYGFENNVLVGPDQKVICYDKTRKSAGLNGVDIGYFIVHKDVLKGDWQGNLSFEQQMLPELIKNKQLSAYVTDEQYYYITNLTSLKRFEQYVVKNQIHAFSQGA